MIRVSREAFLPREVRKPQAGPRTLLVYFPFVRIHLQKLHKAERIEWHGNFNIALRVFGKLNQQEEKS